MHVFIKPALKDNLDRGRPKGGLCTAISNQFKNYVKDISPNSWRLQALKFSFKEEFILINSYLPVDNRQNYQETLETLAMITYIAKEHSPCPIIWTGDLNSDFRRQSAHVNSVQSCIQELHLNNLE